MRAWRTQWRDRSGFTLLLLLTGAFAALMVWRYADESLGEDALNVNTRLRLVGETLWRQSAWLQSAVALLVAPALTAGGIARERERGLLESLQMAPLTPLQIVLEKWASALAPMLLVLGALAPLNLILVLSGGASPGAFYALLAFQIWSAACGAAIGLVCSAWARRAHLALRSAYGYIILWLLGSGAAAFGAGEAGGAPPLPGVKMPIYAIWFGRTNPILAAQDLISNAPYEAKWPVATGAMSLIILAALALSARAIRRPLAEAPFMATKTKRAKRATTPGATAPGATAKTAAPPAMQTGHFEVPIVGALPFANPVMGREVRSKFRLRQPPLLAIVIESLLALAVFYFYLRTIWAGLTDPSSRSIVFWGVTLVGMTVTLISCAIMGANGFSREHEGGTWESLRLSLLRPREIVRGKVGGIALTCALFSIPIWPLLLPCVGWNQSDVIFGDSIEPTQLGAVALVWFGSVIATALWGLWIGRRTRKSSAASGLSLGVGAALLIGEPSLYAILSPRSDMMWMAVINPMMALTSTMDSHWRDSSVVALALPYLLFSLAVSAILWALLERGMKREFDG